MRKFLRRVFCNATPALRVRGVLALCERCVNYLAKQGGTAGMYFMPVLEVQGQALLFKEMNRT